MARVAGGVSVACMACLAVVMRYFAGISQASADGEGRPANRRAPFAGISATFDHKNRR